MKKVFFFVRFLYFRHWLTCSGRKDCSRSRLISFPGKIYQRREQVHSLTNSDVLVEEINSGQILFPGYSIIQRKVTVNNCPSVCLV